MTEQELLDDMKKVAGKCIQLQNELQSELKNKQIGMGDGPSTTRWLVYQYNERRLRHKLTNLAQIGMRNGWIEEIDPDEYF